MRTKLNEVQDEKRYCMLSVHSLFPFFCNGHCKTWIIFTFENVTSKWLENTPPHKLYLKWSELIRVIWYFESILHQNSY